MHTHEFARICAAAVRSPQMDVYRWHLCPDVCTECVVLLFVCNRTQIKHFQWANEAQRAKFIGIGTECELWVCIKCSAGRLLIYHFDLFEWLSILLFAADEFFSSRLFSLFRFGHFVGVCVCVWMCWLSSFYHLLVHSAAAAAAVVFFCFGSVCNLSIFRFSFIFISKKITIQVVCFWTNDCQYHALSTPPSTGPLLVLHFGWLVGSAALVYIWILYNTKIHTRIHTLFSRDMTFFAYFGKDTGELKSTYSQFRDNKNKTLSLSLNLLPFQWDQR